MSLRGKHVVVGITGGIAAYKSLLLIRLLKKIGAEVKVVATTSALQFVTPLTIETLSQNALYSDLFLKNNPHSVDHVNMGDWADCVIVAPATANILAKMAAGIADDALSTLLLACTKPLFVAPAMNVNMYEHPVTQQNIKTLQGRGVHVIDVTSGSLACDVEGKGRMEEPDKIFQYLESFFTISETLHKKTALVTAGPTYEPVDPVRFIGNHSSGLMGFNIAEQLANAGAEVTLVTGPSSLTVHHPHIKRVDVMTASEMYDQCMIASPEADIVVMAAAVADYSPVEVASQKIKKSDETFVIRLKKTKDILKQIGLQKKTNQIVMGFALETENELDNAKAKLINKNADFIVLNSLRDVGAGFSTSTNKVTVISREGAIKEMALQSKKEVAADLVQLIIDKFHSTF